MDVKDLRINGKRLRKTLQDMAKIGATPGGGVQRLTLTDEDKTARDLFVRWLREIDLEVSIDDMGNIFGRRPGNSERPAPGHERLSHRFPAQRRAVRRHPRCHGPPGGHADPS